MSLMVQSKDSFLALGGHLFNRTVLDKNGNFINDPAVLMLDTFDKNEFIYSSESIEKLKTKETNYEFERS